MVVVYARIGVFKNKATHVSLKIRNLSFDWNHRKDECSFQTFSQISYLLLYIGMCCLHDMPRPLLAVGYIGAINRLMTKMHQLRTEVSQAMYRYE